MTVTKEEIAEYWERIKHLYPSARRREPSNEAQRRVLAELDYMRRTHQISEEEYQRALKLVPHVDPVKATERQLERFSKEK